MSFFLWGKRGPSSIPRRQKSNKNKECMRQGSSTCFHVVRLGSNHLIKMGNTWPLFRLFCSLFKQIKQILQQLSGAGIWTQDLHIVNLNHLPLDQGSRPVTTYFYRQNFEYKISCFWAPWLAEFFENQGA